jgi:glycosyltransferase involved in cell wall biosynthesis
MKPTSNPSPPLSVCLLTTSYPTFRDAAGEFPRGKFVHDMARFLARAGIPVDVVTHVESGTAPSSTVDGVRVHRYSAPGVKQLIEGGGLPESVRSAKKRLFLPLYFAGMLWTGLRQARSGEGRIVNAHWAFPTGLIGLALKAASGRPLLITIYGAEVYPFREGHWKWLKPLVGWVIRRADWVAAISPAASEAARAVSGRADIAVIPDGIDVEYYSPGPREPEVAARYGLEDKPFLFFTGRMVERKGHRFILEAMALLSDRPDLHALIGGEGPLSAELHRRREELGLARRVLMPGVIREADLVPLLRTCALYVLPSCVDSRGDTEGSATAALEAMACGAVAILSDVGGNTGAVEEERGAFYVRPADPRDLADRIRAVLARTDLDAQRRLGREAVVGKYSWPQTIASYLRLIGRGAKEDRGT